MPHMIEEFLSTRGARLSESGSISEHRVNHARMIARNFETFDRFRPRLAGARSIGGISPASRDEADLLDRLAAGGFMETSGQARYAPTPDGLLFLTGEWLEDLACAAALDGGADGAVVRAEIKWKVGTFHGSNELDVIARKGDRLVFISCKEDKGTG